MTTVLAGSFLVVGLSSLALPGLAWERKLGETARLAEANGHDPDDLRFVTGLRFWF